MTWREFHLRKMAYEREKKEKWYHTRWLSFHSLAATGAAKGLTLEKHFPLDGKIPQKGMTPEQREALKNAREKANLQLNGSRT